MGNRYLDDEALSAFWERQRWAIVARAQEPSSPSLAGAAAAFAVVALVAAAVLLAPEAPRPALTASDDALLRDIDLLVSRLEPRVLEPARLLLPEEFKEVIYQ